MLELGIVGQFQVVKGCVLFSESGAMLRKHQRQDTVGVGGDRQWGPTSVWICHRCIWFSR